MTCFCWETIWVPPYNRGRGILVSKSSLGQSGGKAIGHVDSMGNAPKVALIGHSSRSNGIKRGST